WSLLPFFTTPEYQAAINSLAIASRPCPDKAASSSASGVVATRAASRLRNAERAGVANAANILAAAVGCEGGCPVSLSDSVAKLWSVGRAWSPRSAAAPTGYARLTAARLARDCSNLRRSGSICGVCAIAGRGLCRRVDLVCAASQDRLCRPNSGLREVV